MNDELRDGTATPPSLARLRWLWIASFAGALAGAVIWGVLAFALTFLPGLRTWIFHSHNILWMASLLFLCLASLGFLIGQTISGLWIWTVRVSDSKQDTARFGLTVGLSAAAALSATSLFLLSWKLLPHSAWLALIWPLAAAMLQLLLLGAGTPWLIMLSKIANKLEDEKGPVGNLIALTFEEIKLSIRGQIPRILIALHGSALAFSLWLSPLLKELDSHKIHHPWISLLQLVVLSTLTLGHLWFAHSAILAGIRNRISYHITPHLAKLSAQIPSPPPELMRWFRPAKTLAPWIRLPWGFVIKRLAAIVDRWEEWSSAANPTERLREFLADEAPTLTLPILVAILQILVSLIPLFLPNV
jgi:hypothetical protein